MTRLQDVEYSLPQEATRINTIEDRLVVMEDQVKTGAENDNQAPPEQPGFVADMETLCTDINRILESKGSVERDIAQLKERLPDPVMLQNIWARLANMPDDQEESHIGATNQPEEGEELQLEVEDTGRYPKSQNTCDALEFLPSRVEQRRQQSRSNGTRKSEGTLTRKSRLTKSSPMSGVSRSVAYDTTDSDSNSTSIMITATKPIPTLKEST